MDHQEQEFAAVVEEKVPQYVLLFPLPMQGHVNPMLKLAQLLCISGFHVTMLLSDYSYSRLLRHANLKSLLGQYRGLLFATISDGLLDDHPRVGDRTVEIMMSLKVVREAQFRNLMVSTDRLSESLIGDGVHLERRPVSCIIMDGTLSSAARVSEEIGIPYIYFRTIGACSFWPYFSIPEVINANENPLRVRGKSEDKESYQKRKEMDLIVTSVPRMEGFLRRRDLPWFFRADDINDPRFETIKTETRNTIKARALILNTFEDLEGPILNQIRKHIPTLFSIGPLHTHLTSRVASKPSILSHSSSFWEEDRSCVTWLDSQPHKSVIYVSFGSVTIFSREELLEFWHGLVNSGQRFLRVMRPDTIVGKSGVTDISVELEEGTKARG